MQKTLQDYITESEAWVNSPAVGDDFGINIREECLVESHIVDVTEDGVILAADDRMIEILESYGLLENQDPYRREVSPPSAEEFEESALGEQRVDSPVASAITRRILNQRPDLLQYGPEAVMAAVDEVAEWVGDVEEIGSSDVSAWVKQVERMLRTQDGQGVAEGSESPEDYDARMRRLAAYYETMSPDKKASLNKIPGRAEQFQQAVDYVKKHPEGVAEGSGELRRIQELAGMPAKAPQVAEGGVKNWVDDLYYEFNERYDLPRDIDDDAYLSVVAKFLNSQGIDPDKIEDIGELFIDMRDHEEDSDHDDKDMMEDAAPEIDYDSLVVDGIDTRDYPDFSDAYFASGEYMDGTPLPEEVLDELSNDGMLLRQHLEKQIYEAKYQGREVPLGKPMAGDVKKSKVYVRGPKGNVVKVNFGDKTMRIKKSSPKRRKNFRARHNCANPGPRWKARYWSCRAW